MACHALHSSIGINRVQEIQLSVFRSQFLPVKRHMLTLHHPFICRCYKQAHIQIAETSVDINNQNISKGSLKNRDCEAFSDSLYAMQRDSSRS